MDFKTFHEANVKSIKEMLLEKQGEQDIPPTIFYWKNEALNIYVVVPPKGHKFTGDYVTVALRTLEEQKPEMLSVANMAWAKTTKAKSAEEATKEYRYGDLSKDPKRMEVLVINSVDSKGRQLAYMAEVKRHNNKISLDESKFKDIKDPTGRMVPSMEHEKPVDYIR